MNDTTGNRESSENAIRRSRSPICLSKKTCRSRATSRIGVAEARDFRLRRVSNSAPKRDSTGRRVGQRTRGENSSERRQRRDSVRASSTSFHGETLAHQCPAPFDVRVQG